MSDLFEKLLDAYVHLASCDGPVSANREAAREALMGFMRRECLSYDEKVIAAIALQDRAEHLGGCEEMEALAKRLNELRFAEERARPEPESAEALLDIYAGAVALQREYETKDVICGYHRHSAMLRIATEDAEEARKKLLKLLTPALKPIVKAKKRAK